MEHSQYWSKDIMGGDFPATVEGDIMVECLGVDYSEYIDNNLTNYRTLIEEKIADVAQFVSRWEGDERNVAYQVLGVMIMAAGAGLPSTIRTRIEQAAAQDEWSKEDDERKEMLIAFVVALSSYDKMGGTPIVIKSNGLFQMLQEEVDLIKE